MHKWIIVLLLGLASTSCASSSREAGGDETHACFLASNNGDANMTVSVCSSALASGRLSDKNRAAVLNNIGQAHIALGQLDEAIASLTEAVALEPNTAIIYNNRGIAYYDAQQYDPALADFDTATKLEPDLPDSYANRGAVYADTGKLDRSLAEYNQAVRLAPNNALVLKDRCLTYLQLGDYDRAVADCNRTLELGPEVDVVVFFRGFARFLQGRYGTAIVDLNDYHVAHPKEPRTILLLHLARAHAGIKDRRELQQQAAALDSAKWPGALIQYFLGQIDEAAASQAAANLAGNPDTSDKVGQKCQADYYLGEGALLAGKTDEARQRFDQAVSHCPRKMLEYYGAKAELRGL